MEIIIKNTYVRLIYGSGLRVENDYKKMNKMGLLCHRPNEIS